MKVVILAGGLGTRLAEETSIRPKPMVEIGGKPVLWHLMHIYAENGFTDFVVACGYRGEVIKEYFTNFHFHSADITIDLASGKYELDNERAPNWRIQLVDTGIHTQTGGRIRRLKSWLGNETFMVTYGDGLADVNIQQALEFHRSHGRIGTITGVQPPSRFGGLDTSGDEILSFLEKPQDGERWINGGFMIFEPEILDLIDSDETILEREPLSGLAEARQLMVFRHEGFWQPMDTLREKIMLENLWDQGNAPWKIWDV
jgi:glucose-1-phosphate cytidylyltransferase